MNHQNSPFIFYIHFPVLQLQQMSSSSPCSFHDLIATTTTKCSSMTFYFSYFIVFSQLTLFKTLHPFLPPFHQCWKIQLIFLFLHLQTRETLLHWNVLYKEEEIEQVQLTNKSTKCMFEKKIISQQVPQ